MKKLKPVIFKPSVFHPDNQKHFHFVAIADNRIY